LSSTSPRIERGAALLDTAAPGWEGKIDLNTLDLSSGWYCVVGQVYGDYIDGLAELKMIRSMQLRVNKRTEDYCAISRHINKEAIWFWTFQNTYYAISSAKLKGLPKIYSGVIDVSNVWME